MVRYAVLVLLIFVVSASHAQAGFYRWVDRDGKEFYTNEPEKVPREYRGQAKSVEVRDDRVSVGQKPVAQTKATVAGGEHRDKHGRGEEYWRKRAANIRMKLRDLQGEYDIILKQEQDEEKQPRQLNSKKKKSASSREKKKAKIEKDIAKVRRLLETDLPEEARRADAYPGWIRE